MKKRFGWLGLPVVAALLLIAVVPANAQVTVFSDRSDWLAATSGSITDIDFEGIAGDNNFVFLSNPPGITLLGVNFDIDRSTSNGSMFVIGKGFYYPDNSVLTSQQSSLVDNNIVITLPGGFGALGFDHGDFIGVATMTVLLSTGDSFDITPPALSNLGFFGVTSVAPITSLRLSIPAANEPVINIDNFSFGDAAAVPEPGSLALLIGLGVTGAGFFVRRRRS